MEAESVGPETEKGGSRQEKDEVAVGWAAECGGGLPYPCEEEEEMERPRLLSNLFSTRVTSPRRETTSTTTSWREPHRSVMRDQTRVFRTRFPLLSQSRHNHTFPTLESDDGAGLATENF